MRLASRHSCSLVVFSPSWFGSSKLRYIDLYLSSAFLMVFFCAFPSVWGALIIAIEATAVVEISE